MLDIIGMSDPAHYNTVIFPNQGFTYYRKDLFYRVTLDSNLLDYCFKISFV